MKCKTEHHSSASVIEEILYKLKKNENKYHVWVNTLHTDGRFHTD